MTTSTEMPASANEAEVAAALQAFTTVLEDADPRKRADIYTDDATFVMPGVPVTQGRAEIRGRLLFSCVQDERPVTLRFLMVLRKETDGAWRIAREFLAAESPSG